LSSQETRTHGLDPTRGPNRSEIPPPTLPDPGATLDTRTPGTPPRNRPNQKDQLSPARPFLPRGTRSKHTHPPHHRQTPPPTPPRPNQPHPPRRARTPASLSSAGSSRSAASSSSPRYRRATGALQAQVRHATARGADRPSQEPAMRRRPPRSSGSHRVAEAQ